MRRLKVLAMLVFAALPTGRAYQGAMKGEDVLFKNRRRGMKRLFAYVLILAILSFLTGCVTIPPAPPLYDAANKGDINAVKVLLDKGADVNEYKNYPPALWIAAYWGHTDIMEILIDKGADVDKAIMGMEQHVASCTKYGWLEGLDRWKSGINLLKEKQKILPNKYGWDFYSKGQYKEAINSFKQAVSLDPSVSSNFSGLSASYIALKQYDEAIAAAKRAIELKSDDAVAYNNLGAAYGMNKQYSEALKALQRAIEIDPKMAVAYDWMGSLFMEKNAYNEAVEAYKKGIEAAPLNPRLRESLSNAYYRMGRYDDAIASVNEAIWLQSSTGTGTNNDIESDYPVVKKEAALSFGLRSLAYRHKGSLEAALKDAEKAYSLDSANDWAQLSLGASYLDRGQYDEAVKLLSQIKDNSTARLLEATTYAKQGKMKEAVDVYLSIPEEELSPKNVSPMNDRMVLLQTFKPIVKEHRDKAGSFESKGQYKEALSELSEALKTADDTEVQDIQETIFSMIRRNPLLSEMPEDARKYALRSEVLVKEGNFEKAATELKKAIQIAPYAARLYFNSALINAELKKYPEAIRYMKIYLQAAPDAPDARAAKDEIIKWEFMMEKGK